MDDLSSSTAIQKPQKKENQSYPIELIPLIEKFTKS
jgi:hypothetical protein